ncbi:FtsX-like permease family protein [Vagococcus sp. JNUCC 83]
MFYLKLAFTNLKKNKRAYAPFILSMIFLVTINVIMQVLLKNKGMDSLPGVDAAKTLFGFGSVVIMIFTLIFSLYTNGFLLKQRKKELGLYNILGMGKRELGKILFIESIMVSLFSIVMGIFTGIIFSKLSFLILKKMTGFGDGFTYSLNVLSLSYISLFFIGIFFLLYVINRIQLKLVNPLELLKGTQTGEKEPKVKWLTGILGIVCIGAGYYMSVTIESPLKAISLFFFAILLVIVGTYALFMASSIMILKFLKRRKTYYYQPTHFIAISNMMYRMKQNAVGLASITVLSTMVLVTLSTTGSLFFGMDNVIKNRNPYDMSLTVPEDKVKEVESLFKTEATKYDVSLDEVDHADLSDSLMVLKNRNEYNMLSKETKNLNAYSLAESLNFMTQDEYNRLEKTNLKLSDKDIALYSMNGHFKEDNVSFGGKRFDVKKVINKITFIPKVSGISNMLFVVVANQKVMEETIKALAPDDFATYLVKEPTVYVNFTGDSHDKLTYAKEMKHKLKKIGDRNTFSSSDIDKEELQSFTGGFLFLGIILGLSFTLATGLIIYYKQISEGIQDEHRYDIMQKVGMSHQEVKKSIRGQILMVFFFPIMLATLHLAFAFPLMTNLLLLFGLSDKRLFLIISIIVVGIFLLIYLAIYSQTSKVYYRLVERKVI